MRRTVIVLLGTLAMALAGASLAWACSPQSVVRLAPSKGLPGAAVIVNGEGYYEGDVKVLWYDQAGERTHLTTATVGADGKFQVEVTVPEDAEPGMYTVKGVWMTETLRYEAADGFTVESPESQSGSGGEGGPGSASHSVSGDDGSSPGQEQHSRTGSDGGRQAGDSDASSSGASSGQTMQGSASDGPTSGQTLQGSASNGSASGRSLQGSASPGSPAQGSAGTAPGASRGQESAAPAQPGQSVGASSAQPGQPSRAGAPQPGGQAPAAQPPAGGQTAHGEPAAEPEAADQAATSPGEQDAAAEPDEPAEDVSAGRADAAARQPAQAPSTRSGAADLWSGFVDGEGDAGGTAGLTDPAGATQPAQPGEQLTLAFGLLASGALVLATGGLAAARRRRVLVQATSPRA